MVLKIKLRLIFKTIYVLNIVSDNYIPLPLAIMFYSNTANKRLFQRSYSWMGGESSILHSSFTWHIGIVVTSSGIVLSLKYYPHTKQPQQNTMSPKKSLWKHYTKQYTRKIYKELDSHLNDLHLQYNA